MKVASSMLVVFLGALLLAPAAVGAGAQRTDPDASSPAGVIYEIPLDAGRKDGAPHTDHGSGGGGTSSDSGSNGEGSGGASGGSDGQSGDGGGASAADAGGSAPVSSGEAPRTAAGRSGTGPGGATPDDPSSIHSENGFGSSSRVPGAATDTAVRAASVGGSGTPGAAYALMAIVAAAALYLGFAASGSLRR